MPSPTQRFNQKFWATRLNYHYSITSLLAYICNSSKKKGSNQNAQKKVSVSNKQKNPHHPCSVKKNVRNENQKR
jgi:hypothetical protein